MSDPTINVTPAVTAPSAATPDEETAVRDELNVMFDTWKRISELGDAERSRVGSWLKDHLHL